MSIYDEGELKKNAMILVEEIKYALARGTKHYRVSDNKLLETPEDIILTLVQERQIIFKPKK